MKPGSLWRLALAATVAAAASVWAIRTLETTYFWVALAWASLCLYAMLRSKTTALRALWFNVAVVLVAVGVLEGYVTMSGPRAQRQEVWSNGGDMYVRDDVLGHRPPADYANSCKLYFGEELVFDASYSTGANGLRVSPPEKPEDPRACVLFFGGSYTFGEGVDDEETTAYLVGRRSGGRYRVRNFGFSGYGPHQMLAQIESGLVERVADCEPTYAIYQAHPHHVLRSAGKWWWDEHGPRYALTADGEVRREGNFDDDTGYIDSLLTESAAVERARDNIRPDAADVELFHAIVQKSRRLLEQAYPGIAFHVLYWDIGDPWLFDNDERSAGLTVHPIREIFPERERWDGIYTFENDVHPTPHAHSLMADHIVANVLTPDGGAATAAAPAGD